MRHRHSVHRMIWTCALCVAMALPAMAASDAEREQERRPHHARMLLETGIFMLVGTAWYFSGQDLNAQDWDLEVTGPDVKEKFFTTNQIRFDNNTFIFNQMWHPLSYAGIYLVGRSNNLDPWVAFAYAFFSSLLWEYVGELREKVSINDQIVSSLTAMAWGEVLYHYGEYFNHPESGTRVWRSVASVFGIPRLFHDWLDDTEQVDEPGRLYHLEPRLALGSALRSYRRDDVRGQTLGFFTAESQMAVMLGYGEEGEATELFNSGNFSDFSFQFAAAPDAVEVDIDATAVIGGLYRRNIRPGRGDGNGYDLMIGGGRGYRLVTRDMPELKDKFGLVHILGPVTRLRTFGPGPLRIEAGLDAFFDFSAVHSHAVPQLVQRYGQGVLDTIRTDVQKHSYYFGFGFTVAPQLAFVVDRWRLEFDAQISRIRSIQGLDRFQEKVTRTIILNDLIWESRGLLNIPLPPDWLNLRLESQLHHRRSSIDEVQNRRRWIDVRASLQATF